RNVSGLCGHERSRHRIQCRSGYDELYRAVKLNSPVVAFGGGLFARRGEGGREAPFSPFRSKSTSLVVQNKPRRDVQIANRRGAFLREIKRLAAGLVLIYFFDDPAAGDRGLASEHVGRDIPYHVAHRRIGVEHRGRRRRRKRAAAPGGRAILPCV